MKMKSSRLQRVVVRRLASASLVSLGLGISGCASLDTELAGPKPIIDAEMAGGSVALPGSSSTGTVRNIGALVKNFEEAAAAAKQEASSSSTTEVKRAAYIRFARAGVVVADARCELYFREIGLRARGLTFWADEIGQITSALAAILKDIDPDTLAAGNVVGNLTGTSLRSFRDAYFYSPDVGNVHKLVTDASAEAAKVLDDAATRASYEDAISFLISYQAICQPHSIRNLVNNAVAKAAPVAKAPAAATAESRGPNRSARPRLSAFTIDFK